MQFNLSNLPIPKHESEVAALAAKIGLTLVTSLESIVPASFWAKNKIFGLALIHIESSDDPVVIEQRFARAQFVAAGCACGYGQVMDAMSVCRIASQSTAKRGDVYLLAAEASLEECTSPFGRFNQFKSRQVSADTVQDAMHIYDESNHATLDALGYALVTENEEVVSSDYWSWAGGFDLIINDAPLDVTPANAADYFARSVTRMTDVAYYEDVYDIRSAFDATLYALGAVGEAILIAKKKPLCPTLIAYAAKHGLDANKSEVMRAM